MKIATKQIKTTVAIYSGTIPSTTFIERLIKGVTEKGFTVLLFGTIHQKVKYQSQNVHVIGNRKGLIGVIQSILRVLQLRIKSDHYIKLKHHLGFGPFMSVRAFRTWQKFVPVVLNLPNVFHVQWAKAAGEWLFLKEQFDVKLVLSLRGAHINYSPLADAGLATMYQKVLPSYDAYHAVSDAIMKEGLPFGVLPEKAITIYSGIESEGYPAPRKFFEDDKIRLLVVGRMHWKKGYHYLLDSINFLKAQNVSFKLTLIAQGVLPEEIAYQLHDLQLQGEVEWVNGLPHQVVLTQMSLHDVLILPSVEEGIANVVLEAMNIGLPVISTDCGGMREVIENGVNGFLVPVRHPQIMAEAIIKFSTLSIEAINSIRVHAHETIMQKFNADKSMESFSALYQRVMACE